MCVCAIKMMKLKIKDPYFGNIKDGKKVVEGRWNKKDRHGRKTYEELKKDIDDGKDVLLKIICGEGDSLGEMLYGKIKYVKKYGSFREMLECEGIGRVLPDVDSIEEGVDDVYYELDGYEDGEKKGVFAIGIGDMLK